MKRLASRLTWWHKARPPAAVLRGGVRPDLARARARGLRVVIAGDRVDEAATAERRAARQVEALRTASAGAQSAGDPVRFDFGPARREHERPWPPELQDAFIELLMSLPAPYRAYVHRTLHARAETLSDQRPLTPGDLQRLWLELRGSVGFR